MKKQESILLSTVDSSKFLVHDGNLFLARTSPTYYCAAQKVLINQFRIGRTVSGLVALPRDPIVFAIFTAAIFLTTAFGTQSINDGMTQCN